MPAVYLKFIVYSYWKRLWRWISSQSLTKEELENVLDNSVVQALKEGLASYKPSKTELFSQLQTKYSDHTKLLNIVQTLQNYIVSLSNLFLHYTCK